MTLKEKVAEMLTRFMYTRDDDNQLAVKIWTEQLEEKGYSPFVRMEIGSALAFITDKTLYNYDSITRARRELQEFRPALRGENWYKNHQS